MLACDQGNVEMVKYLLEQGANTNIKEYVKAIINYRLQVDDHTLTIIIMIIIIIMNWIDRMEILL